MVGMGRGRGENQQTKIVDPWRPTLVKYKESCWICCCIHAFFGMLFTEKQPHKVIQYYLLLSFSEDEMEEANGNNPIDIEVEQNKESKKEV